MKPSKIDIWKQLTWDDIKGWAGASITSRGRNYQSSNYVQKIACTSDGGLLAWVEGTKTYATLVDIKDDKLISFCTCPYDDVCKHAVAVVLDYLEKLKQHIRIPTVVEGDPRLTLLHKGQEGVWYEEDEDPEQADAQLMAPRGGKAVSDAVHSYLKKQNKEDLITLIEDIAEHYPEVYKAIYDRDCLSQGNVSTIVSKLGKEIDRLNTEPAWTDPWRDGGSEPDYSEIRNRLLMLLTEGYADEVVDLGKRLLEAGVQQVEMSDDEGETAEEIADCMEVVFRALYQSSMPPAEKILWAIDADLEDEYDLCIGDKVFWEQEYATADWSTVADKLLHRLKTLARWKAEDSFSMKYRRDNLVDWIITALENANRQDEIIPLCEQEAIETGSYVRLVEHLLAANRCEEAEKWIHKGINTVHDNWSGVASQLRDMLRGLREQEKDWLSVAAFRCDDFLAHPTLETYKTLKEAAEHAEVWPSVRMAALHYLETGEFPERAKEKAGDTADNKWPLPDTGVRKTGSMRQDDFPMTRTLIDIAIDEKQPDEVIRWYDRRIVPPFGFGLTWFQDDKVAKAITETYPDRAITIWKKLAEDQIAQTKPKAYEVAAGFLRSMRHTLKKLEREKEWQNYVAGLRQANARKKRLLEVPDSLEGRPIIEIG